VIDTREGFGAVVLSLLKTLDAPVQQPYSPAVASRLAAGITHLFATLVALRTQQTAAQSASPRDHMVLRIRDHIERNLEDATLSPENVAKAQHISVRHLHRLFEDEPVTVAKLIQRRRLEQCARELALGGKTAPPVAAVAQRWGFTSPAHFSRVFRSVYGLPPRDWRNARLVIRQLTGPSRDR
jgi:AraC-like DNA-binding protein